MNYSNFSARELGGADAAFDGIGINGHLAFNEAREDLTAEEFTSLGTRIVALDPETRTTHFPVSLLQDHPDAVIYANNVAAAQPF